MPRHYLLILILTGTLMISAGTIDLDNLFNYVNQNIPTYILRDNTPPWNQLSNEGATLGRVLFYDKKLSANHSIACASCHQQEFAFGDTARLSLGLNGGLTGRHSMRLVNARFGDEVRFFWDERASTLEEQTTMPIQDHVEMGFSGGDGDPGLDSLIRRLSQEEYYLRLFDAVYGDDMITAERIENALAQFIRSIQSFDAKYDVGRAQVNNDPQPFPNFTPQENMGKNLFLAPSPQGGAGCAGCHQPPEFSIAPNRGNNGVIGVAGDPTAIDLTNTRAPSLRDLLNPNGSLNGPLMHNGSFTSLLQVINHYDSIPDDPRNTNLDQRLRTAPGGPGGPPPPQNLQLTQAEKNALLAFLGTLTGSDLYTNEKWSNPFDSLGKLTILPNYSTAIEDDQLDNQINIYPNPTKDQVNLNLPYGDYQLTVMSLNGKTVGSHTLNGPYTLHLNQLTDGIYLFQLTDQQTGGRTTKKIIKY